jgi:hypothetical protein
MGKGIIYVMSTVVPGLIKIGKTGTANFNSRMYNLERNGYFNVAGLQCKFAIEVNNYDEKEELLDEIFSKSRIPNSELFALDIDLVIQLLSSFEGTKIFPEKETKEQVFDEVAAERRIKRDWVKIPDGIYHISGNKKGFGPVTATMKVKNGSFIVQKGSTCVPVDDDKWIPEVRRTAPIKDNKLQADVACNSPSSAGWIVWGRSNDGWKQWKDQEGHLIEIFRTASRAGKKRVCSNSTEKDK